MIRILFTAAMVLSATSVLSQHAHGARSVTETGQSQFAAIAEIVALLRADPNTDWAQVDITALREHLIDMDNVTMRAMVEQAAQGLSVSFVVTGDATVAPSIQRMVMAHSPMLQKATGWSVAADIRQDGATMLVNVATMAEMREVRALGFFGLMTIGAHHQQHHLMIASGHSPH